MSKIKQIINSVDIFIMRSFIALLIGLGLIIIFFIFILSYNNCPTEQMRTITNLSGLDFEIVAVKCTNVWANVFVSKTGTKQKTLIFVFDPVLIKDNRYVPQSIAVYDRDITISIERIAEIISKEDMWNDYGPGVKP
jgi:hypothetical protein